jgi:hypothetical protein
LAHREAVLGRQVHSGGDNLKFHISAGAQFVQYPIQQTVFRTAARNDTNTLTVQCVDLSTKTLG